MKVSTLRKWKSWDKVTATYSIVRKQSWDADEERIRIIDGRDRAQLFIDGKWVATQYQTEIGEDIFYQGKKKNAL